MSYICRMQIRLGQIAEILGAVLIGDPNTPITGASKIEEGKEGTITFLANPKYASYLATTRSSAVIVQRDFLKEEGSHPALLLVENVYMALSVLMAHFQQKLTLAEGISPYATIDATAEIGEGTSIDAQVMIRKNVVLGRNVQVFGQVFIGDDSRIGDNTILYPGVKIYHNCVVGARCVIHANAVIGSDGFGFAKDEEGNYNKIPQTGNVVIGNDVEIGSNTVVDRASLGSTVLEDGVKLDNLIQVAHNVTIGKRTVIAAQAGIAGSSKVGEDSIIGGQVGIVGHLTLADKIQIQAQSGIASSITEPGSKWYGTPAIQYQNYLKSYAHFKQLSSLHAEVARLAKEIEQIKAATHL